MSNILYFVKQLHSYSGKILYVNLLAMMLIGLLEGAGILLLIPMISMSGIVELELEGTSISNVFKYIEAIPISFGLPLILSIFILVVFGQNFLQRSITVQNAMIQHGFFRNIRIETYHGLLHADWDFFIKRRKSDLINIMTGEIARAGAGTNSFLQLMSSFIFTCIQIGIAFWLSPSITIFVLTFGLILIYFNRKFLKKSLELGNTSYELGKSYLAGITDQINGIKDIKSNTLEESRLDWYRSITKTMKNNQVEYTKLNTKSQLYYKVAASVLIALFIFIAIKMFHAQGVQLVLIVIIFSRLWPRVAGIQASLEHISAMIPSFKAVRSIQNECKKALEFQSQMNQDIDRMIIEKAIECRGVFFRYDKQNPVYALQNINITIPTNHITALVGRSGAGKSTLVDLLMGLNRPESGNVLIDGKPLIRDQLMSWRRSIGYVSQDPFLFNTSIKENLTLVEPQATEKQIWEALEFSSAAEFVRKLPDGLHSLIGDRGIKLSGGERQRLVLARAILRKPSILVLDEATSSLDGENEQQIQEALERLKGKMTLIVIAHRLSTIRNADQVIVLDGGQVIQIGGFSQLTMEKRSVFSNLLSNQM